MNLIAVNLMLPFLTALGCLIFFQNLKIQKIASFVGLFASLGTSIALLLEINQVSVLSHMAGGWPSPFGIALVVDKLSAPLLVLTPFLALLTFVFRLGVSDSESESNPYYLPLFQFLIAGITGALSTGDFFNLYVFFEIFLMASFALLSQNQSLAATMGTTKYVILNLLGSLIFLTGLGLLYSQTGTLNMAAASKHVLTNTFNFKGAQDLAIVGLPFLFFALAFAMKAAVFPLYSWLPASYPLADSATTALLAGTLTKVGVYALLRTQHLGLFRTLPFLNTFFLVIGALTMIIGVFGAANQSNIARILSVHIISQVGYMIVCLGIGTGKALTAALLFMAHNMLVKTNLFFVSGFISRTQGSGDLGLLGSCLKLRPVFSVIFLVSAMSLVGFPPLSGFWAKFYVFSVLIEGKQIFVLGVGALTGIFTLYSMVKIWNEAFLKNCPSEKNHPLTTPELLGMYAPMIIISILVILSAVLILPLSTHLSGIAKYLSDPKIYIENQMGVFFSPLERR